jgi:hypothetical protein
VGGVEFAGLKGGDVEALQLHDDGVGPQPLPRDLHADMADGCFHDLSRVGGGGGGCRWGEGGCTWRLGKMG